MPALRVHKHDTRMTQDTQSPADQADYGDHVIWRLVGSKITSFGGNDQGEIYLSTDKGDEFIIGKDENGDISLFEVEKPASVVSHE